MLACMQPPAVAGAPLSSEEFLAVYNVFVEELGVAVAAGDQVWTRVWTWWGRL